MAPRRLAGQQGVALPMALMCLALLVPLMLAFASLTLSEPIIAGNQLRASQARALAESGLEYALWALSSPGWPGGLPSPLPGPPASPFDGRTFVALGRLGGFTVHVVNHAGGDPHVRTITAVGWTPDNAVDRARLRAHRQVIADAVTIPRPGARAPCALCAGGALEVAGNVAIDGTNRDPACGGDGKYGTLSGEATTVTGPAVISGGGGASAQHQPAGALDDVTLSPAALDALEAIARRSGTYFGPGFPRGGLVSDGAATWGGHAVFDASAALRDGVVFVDTPDGRPVDPGATTALATARFEAGAIASPDGVFRGWIVVNGSLEIAAGLRVRGLVYAADALVYRAAGAGSVEGLVVARGARGTRTRLETAGGGGLAITFDCQAAAGGGSVPSGFALVPGSYREERD